MIAVWQKTITGFVTGPDKAERIAITCENLFMGKGGNIDRKECHALEYYYLMSYPEDAEFRKKNDESEELVWVSLDELTKNDIRPAFLKEKIKVFLSDIRPHNDSSS